MRTRRVVVVGGGVAGLSAAFRIRSVAQARGESVDVRVLEAGASSGGKIGSVRDGDWLCETGPNGFLDNEPATLRLVDDLGLRPRLLRSRDVARRRYLVRRGSLVEMHMHPVKFLKSPLLSFGAKLRMAGEYFRAAKTSDAEESVGAFGRRRLGREFTEVMLDSMVSGIYAGDVDRLSVAAAFPKIVELEKQYGGLFKGMLGRQKERRARLKAAAGSGSGTGSGTGTGSGSGDRPVQAGPSGVLHSFTDGMGDAISALQTSLGDAVVQCNAAAARLERYGESRGYRVVLADGQTVDADVVVSTVPAPAASLLLAELAPGASKELADIPIAGVHVVCLGFARSQIGEDVEAFGALIPRREGIRTLGAIFSSATFEGRAPEGSVLLTCMIGGRHDPDANELDDDALVRQVLSDVKPLLAIEGSPEYQRVFRWARGIPQYELGHLGRVERARADLAAHPGVWLGGNSVAGVSFNQCVQHAEELGEEVCDFLFGEASVDDEGARVHAGARAEEGAGS